MKLEMYSFIVYMGCSQPSHYVLVKYIQSFLSHDSSCSFTPSSTGCGSLQAPRPLVAMLIAPQSKAVSVISPSFFLCPPFCLCKLMVLHMSLHSTIFSPLCLLNYLGHTSTYYPP